MSLLRHENLKAFKQLGFAPEKVAGNQVLGTCVFCSSHDKMYMNPVTKTWDCKKCGRAGGFKSFLHEAVSVFKTNFKGQEAMAFSNARSLSVAAMKKHEFGYNPANDSFILPIYNIDHSDIWDIRVYKNKKFMSLSGCQVGLFGWDAINASSDVIWLCEGEWDKIALEMILKENNVDDSVLAVPGASTFKAEWVSLFDGKTVHVMYDHDDPGKKGASKVAIALATNTKKLKFVHWPKNKKTGYDVRDYLIDTASKKASRLDRLEKMLKEHPPEIEGNSCIAVTKSATKIDKYSGPYIECDKVCEVYRKWLHLPSTEVLDVMFGTMIANRLDGDPLWLFLVAPPGGTKTELLNSISSAPNTVTTSSLTSKSLVSGANTVGGGDPSLIPKLDHKVLLIKDFTTILNINVIERDSIFGILRDAYDGKTEKDFGNGIHRSYVSKFGIISGVTPAIELYTEGSTSLGERFLRYDIPIPHDAKGRHAYLLRAEQNAGKETLMRKELADIGTAVLSHNFEHIPIIDDKLKNQTIALAQFLAKMRGTVVRDKFTREITHSAFSELGTRIVKQFTKLMYGIGMYRNVSMVDDDIYAIVKHMALSTIPQRLEKIVRYMYENDPECSYKVEDFTKLLKLPSLTCSRLLENLDMLGIVDQRHESLLKTEWTLNEDGIYLIEEGKIYE